MSATDVNIQQKLIRMPLSIKNKKFIHKYLRLAKQIGEDNTPCYSRKIGSIILNPNTNSIIATGYNGAPASTPHTDNSNYLKMLWDTLLTSEDKKFLKKECEHTIAGTARQKFLKTYCNKGVCPRKALNIPSGQRLELCSDAHSEANAIVNAAKNGVSTNQCWIFCYCGIPCCECTKLIINAGIRKVFCLKLDPKYDYSPQSRWLFDQANVDIIEISTQDLNNTG